MICKGESYTLIQRNGYALLEDEFGNTKVVEITELARGVGKSTPGHNDGNVVFYH